MGKKFNKQVFGKSDEIRSEGVLNDGNETLGKYWLQRQNFTEALDESAIFVAPTLNRCFLIALSSAKLFSLNDKSSQYGWIDLEVWRR